MWRRRRRDPEAEPSGAPTGVLRSEQVGGTPSVPAPASKPDPLPPFVLREREAELLRALYDEGLSHSPSGPFPDELDAAVAELRARQRRMSLLPLQPGPLRFGEQATTPAELEAVQRKVDLIVDLRRVRDARAEKPRASR
jgi:hypothetical protein